MACYHPLKAFRIGTNPSGKAKLKIASYDCDYVDISNFNGNDVVTCHSGKPFFSTHTKRIVTEFTEIPCGQCLGCRLEYSRQWANRCMLELEDHDSSYFVTLTYDPDHVHYSYTCDHSTGEVNQEVMTLCKRDFQLFMKRLRKALPDQKLRYFACGEYGSKTFRPHYHAIIFGLKLNDLKFYKRQSLNGLSYNYYNSETLDRAWSIDGVKIGYVVVGKVTWETCAYTARYIMKKQKGEGASVYSDFNIEPPFSLMSRKPGIARSYYEQHKDLILLRSFFSISTEDGGRKIYPPRYYHQLFDIEFPEDSARLKEARKTMMKHKKELKLAKTDNSYIELLAIEERNKKASIKSLERNFV